MCLLLPPNINVGNNILCQDITELGELENAGREHFGAGRLAVNGRTGISM